MIKANCFFLSCAVSLTGCAHFDFNDYTNNGKGLVYYEPEPYLLLSRSLSADGGCTVETAVKMIPGKKKLINPVSGIGSTDLSMKIDNGFITELGQKGDTKIPETISSLAAFMSAAKGNSFLNTSDCIPSTKLYSIRYVDEGKVELKEVDGVVLR